MDKIRPDDTFDRQTSVAVTTWAYLTLNPNNSQQKICLASRSFFFQLGRTSEFQNFLAFSWEPKSFPPNSEDNKIHPLRTRAFEVIIECFLIYMPVIQHELARNVPQRVPSVLGISRQQFLRLLECNHPMKSWVKYDMT